MSVRTSVSTTPQNSSPSPYNSPGCGYCHSDASLIDSPQMSPWSTISAPPTSPSAQDIYAAMLAVEAPPPADNESSSLVTEMMAAARAKAGHVPRTHTSEPSSPLALTSEQLDFSTRVEAALATSSALITEAKAQLAAPITAPAELTPSEKAEARRNAAWDATYQKNNEAIDRAMERNQALFEDVMATIDEMEAQGIPMPDCDDLLTWESNAGSAGTPSRTAARWPGMSVFNLVAKFNGWLIGV
jgi:hypothetical protein